MLSHRDAKFKACFFHSRTPHFSRRKHIYKLIKYEIGYVNRNRILERVINEFLKRHNLPKLTGREIDNV